MHGHLLQAGLGWSVGRITLLMLLFRQRGGGDRHAVRVDSRGGPSLPIGAVVAALPCNRYIPAAARGTLPAI